MGLVAPLAEFFMLEHRYRPITGKALFIGRQTIFLKAYELARLLRKYDLPLPTEPPELDTETLSGKYTRFITDRYFMKALGVNNLTFLDVSNYEGAEIVHDLCLPVPQELHGQFDFIYNGSCLDNMFNPAQGMINLAAMLKPGGRIISIEHATSMNGPYLIFTPGFFHDYYTVNRFRDSKVYLCGFEGSDGLCYGPWDMFYHDWEINKGGYGPNSCDNYHYLVVSLAEKGDDSTYNVQPIQYQYRSEPAAETFMADMLRFKASSRPVIQGDNIYPIQKTELFRPVGRLNGTRTD